MKFWIFWSLIHCISLARANEDEAITRTNFASLDCAAAVVKSDAGAINPNNILSENRDSYLINECRNKDKYLVVQLCQDILIDTVLLANYEFFSSMFRDIKIYASDRYPVGLNGWTLLGEFHAENSRTEQVFPVSCPQIWARFLRIELDSHYGHEVYCPLSTLKVYGTTMLDQLKKKTDPIYGGVIPSINTMANISTNKSTLSVESTINDRSDDDCDTTCDAETTEQHDSLPIIDLVSTELQEKCYIGDVPIELRQTCPVERSESTPLNSIQYCGRCARKALQKADAVQNVLSTEEPSIFEVLTTKVGELSASISDIKVRTKHEVELLSQTLSQAKDSNEKCLSQSAELSNSLLKRIEELESAQRYQRWGIVAESLAILIMLLMILSKHYLVETYINTPTWRTPAQSPRSQSPVPSFRVGDK